jgi:hypothetical protein
MSNFSNLSLAFKKTKIKTTLTFHHTGFIMAIIKKTNTSWVPVAFVCNPAYLGG